MYLASARQTPEVTKGQRLRGRLPGTVFALGAVSLLTDISAEMVTAFMPLYLLYTLQLGYVQFGLLDGLYNGATVVLRLVGGYLADRLGRHKAVALVGYGMSGLMKLAFPFAGASALGIGGVLAVDRAGKGLRTAPRDALISLSTPVGDLGRAFGVHRAMDTFGALLGPIATFWILTNLGRGSDLVFWVSFCFALLGVIVLVTFVNEPKPLSSAKAPEPSAQKRPKVSPRAGLNLLRDKEFRRATGSAALLGFATISDAFVYVVLQRTADVPAGILPLLPLGTALVFLLAAIPLGRIADRIGRWTVFIAGHVALLGAYLALLLPSGGFWLVALVLGLHGLFYAATDGVLMAFGGALVPAELRASGLAVVQSGQAVARLLSSVLFGVLLTLMPMRSAMVFAVVALVVALPAVLMMTRREERV